MEIQRAMIEGGFGALCRGSSFCSRCRTVACTRCCPEHLVRHHAGAGEIVDVAFVKGVAAVSALAIKKGGFGYDWRHIHRPGSKLIMLTRHPQDHRHKSKCQQCGDPVRTKSLYCSPGCKTIAVPRGQSLHIVQDLVHTDFRQGSLMDRFCIVCMKAFSSGHCPDHHLHQHADGGAMVVEIIQHEGWMLVRDDLLDAQSLDGIARIDVGGALLVPVRRRKLPNTEGLNQCVGLGCTESVENLGDVCSMMCRLEN